MIRKGCGKWLNTYSLPLGYGAKIQSCVSIEHMTGRSRQKKIDLHENSHSQTHIHIVHTRSAFRSAPFVFSPYGAPLLCYCWRQTYPGKHCRYWAFSTEGAFWYLDSWCGHGETIYIWYTPHIQLLDERYALSARYCMDRCTLEGCCGDELCNTWELSICILSTNSGTVRTWAQCQWSNRG